MSDLKTFLSRPAYEIAPLLLGALLEREIDGKIVRVKIVETEAYDQTDAASHSFSGRTPRTDIMFGEPGHLYVYFTYGMHYCCNIVTEGAGVGAAILIRAVEPLVGEDTMRQWRPVQGTALTNGPAKLCQALAIDRQMNGHDLEFPPLKLLLQPALPVSQIIQTTRVGISKAKEVRWRFYIKDNPYVSKW